MFIIIFTSGQQCHILYQYFHFPDFSMVLFLDLVFVIIYLKTLSVSTCRWRWYLPNPNRVYPCSTMFTFIFSVWCSSIDAKQSCFKNLQNICRVVCWTIMCFGFWKSDKFAQQLQGSLLDTFKLRLLGSLANLPSMGMHFCN